jgi:glycosyltransferase involved in cell wall biosynthesis
MKILWINPSFLDYRIPVYEELNNLCGNELSVVFSKDTKYTPLKVSERLEQILKKNAIGLLDSKTIHFIKQKEKGRTGFANKSLKLNYQPGLLKTVLNVDADVIIVEGFFQWSPSGFLKKLFHRKPLVLSYERTFHTERNAPKWREFYRKLISKIFIDSAVVNGSLCKEYTNYLGVNSKKIFTGGMAANSIFFREKSKKLNKNDCREEWSIDSDKLIFLYVGRFIKLKGIIELLKGWKTIENNNIELICVGDGEERKSIEEYLNNNSIENVKLLGNIDYEILPSIYRASDVFIIPTLEDNWSLVVPEAMACGLPIACSKYNGCWPELVHDDINGKVFDPLDETSVINTLNYFYENKEKLEDMGKKSSEIEEKYNPKYAAKNIYKACEIALKGK